MPLNIEIRQSDSPFVERIWRSRSENINSFTSIAASRLDLVVWKHQGKTHLSIQGPESKASRAPVPEDAEFFGILFKTGTYMPHLPMSQLVNNNIMFPQASSKSFWLKSEAWQLPTYDNAETFVDWLIRDGVIVYEPIVGDVLRGHLPFMSLRSIQRRFLYSAGLTYRTMQQIERARQAAVLLREGLPILDVTYRLGYFDQAYLTKSLKHFIGQTPTQLVNNAEELSLLYKTDPYLLNYDVTIDNTQQREAS